MSSTDNKRVRSGAKFTTPQGFSAITDGIKTDALNRNDAPSKPGDRPRERKPPWLRVRIGGGEAYQAVRDTVRRELGGDTSSLHDRTFASSHLWIAEDGDFDIGEVVAWVFNTEEQGQRGKC